MTAILCLIGCLFSSCTVHERAKLESSDQHMAAINTHISLLESLGRLLDSEAFSSCFFLSVLLGCFPGAAITHLPSDRLNQRFLFLTSKPQCLFSIVFLLFLWEWRWFCYNILSSDSNVRKCLSTATSESLSRVFKPASLRARLEWMEKWSCFSISKVQW